MAFQINYHSTIQPCKVEDLAQKGRNPEHFSYGMSHRDCYVEKGFCSFCIGACAHYMNNPTATPGVAKHLQCLYAQADAKDTAHDWSDYPQVKHALYIWGETFANEQGGASNSSISASAFFFFTSTILDQIGLFAGNDACPQIGLFAGNDVVVSLSGLWWSAPERNVFRSLASQNLGKYISIYSDEAQQRATPRTRGGSILVWWAEG